MLVLGKLESRLRVSVCEYSKNSFGFFIALKVCARVSLFYAFFSADID